LRGVTDSIVPSISLTVQANGFVYRDSNFLLIFYYLWVAVQALVSDAFPSWDQKVTPDAILNLLLNLEVLEHFSVEER
jgi:hypothetical protein